MTRCMERGKEAETWLGWETWSGADAISWQGTKQARRADIPQTKIVPVFLNAIVRGHSHRQGQSLAGRFPRSE